MQQQLARPRRIGLDVRRRRRQRRDVRADQHDLAVLDDDVGFLQLRAPGADRLDLPALERESRLEFLLDEIVVIGFFVFDDAHGRSCVASRPQSRIVAMRSVHKSVLVPYSAAADVRSRRARRALSAIPAVVRRRARSCERTADETGAHRHRLPRRARAFHHRQSQPAAGPDRHHAARRPVSPPRRRAGGFARSRDAACKVEFELAYEFATPVLEGLIGPVFGHIADTLHRRLRQTRRGGPRRRRVKRIAVTVVYALPAGATEIGARAAGRARPSPTRSRVRASRHATRTSTSPRWRSACTACGSRSTRRLSDGDRVEIYRPLHRRPEGPPAPARRPPQRGLTRLAGAGYGGKPLN